MVNITTAASLRAEQEKEYGTYVAAEEIRIDGVLAFGIGYPVPVSHTEEYPQLLQRAEDGTVPVVTVEEYRAAQEQKAAEAEAEAVATEPAADGARSKWVAFAQAQGAPDSELVKVADGGLSRDELAAKYGAGSN